MKCPYQTIITHVPEHKHGCEIFPAEDRTVFGYCSEGECPFYYETGEIKKEKHCKKAEVEGGNKS